MTSLRLFPAFVLLATLGCAAAPDAGGPSQPAPQTDATLSAASVAGALRSAGVAVEDAGIVEQPFFGVPARVFVADGRDVQVYEFPSAAAAEKAATEVSPEGGSIGTSTMRWMASPHFFRKDRLIVNYIGTSEKTLEALRNMLGPQFAGR